METKIICQNKALFFSKEILQFLTFIQSKVNHYTCKDKSTQIIDIRFVVVPDPGVSQ